ncbi:MAG: shikimate kinase [Planctomycetota bacterium]|jgi:XRE family aerobic/anaerobic benzoate catabolism transcriptional regulator
MVGHAFLRELGRRLRSLRLESGLSVQALADRAQVSRRYLTEAEAGRANPSALVLARLASALEVPLGRLLDLPVRARSGERVALVGLRGAGKSTVGRRLALALEVPFVELDAEVERLAELQLAELFELHGVETFRRYQREALEQTLRTGDRLVIATGGSIVEDPETYERLLDTCRTAWLRASPLNHWQRVIEQGDRRPMRDRPRAMGELEDLLERRRADYERCDLELLTDDLDPEAAVEELLGWLAREFA